MPNIIEQLEKRARQGDVGAQFHVAAAFALGEKVERDDEQAVYWFRQAAEQGDVAAQYFLSRSYYLSEGVEKDDEQAFRWCQLAAEQGYPSAQFCMCQFYFLGEGVEKDDVQAFRWCQLAAEQGHPRAQVVLGIRYMGGIGVRKDKKQGAHWFKLAAEQGEDDAQNNLGQAYLVGNGVKQDYKIAIHWFRLSAVQGVANAQNSLGVMYFLGQGVEQDYEMAVHWVRLAAKQGHSTAQNNLGESYKLGTGVERDYEKAFHWFNLSAEQGERTAQSHLGAAYELGQGVEKNDELASYWHNLSTIQDRERTIIVNYSIVDIEDHQSKSAKIITFPGTDESKPVNLKEDFENRFVSHPYFEDFRASLEEIIKEELLPDFDKNFRDGKLGHYSIDQALASGETQTVEYKETFSFNTREKKSGDDRIRHAFLREAAAFLNTEGGAILVGVSDDQKVIGIERDDFKDAENYIRKISQVVASALGELAATLTDVSIHEHSGQKICVVLCAKSPKPIYCDFKKFGQQTFVRYGNVTAQPPPSEWVEYCKYHFD
jgi:TPR repeat protein